MQNAFLGSKIRFCSLNLKDRFCLFPLSYQYNFAGELLTNIATCSVLLCKLQELNYVRCKNQNNYQDIHPYLQHLYSHVKSMWEMFRNIITIVLGILSFKFFFFYKCFAKFSSQVIILLNIRQQIILAKKYKIKLTSYERKDSMLWLVMFLFEPRIMILCCKDNQTSEAPLIVDEGLSSFQVD